jgi:hypothetical protein
MQCVCDPVTSQPATPRSTGTPWATKQRAHRDSLELINRHFYFLRKIVDLQIRKWIQAFSRLSPLCPVLETNTRSSLNYPVSTSKELIPRPRPRCFSCARLKEAAPRAPLPRCYPVFYQLAMGHAPGRQVARGWLLPRQLPLQVLLSPHRLSHLLGLTGWGRPLPRRGVGWCPSPTTWADLGFCRSPKKPLH